MAKQLPFNGHAGGAMLVDVVRTDQLSAADREAWRRFCLAQPGLASPFLCPSFAEAVAQVRRDVFVAVGRDAEGPAAFWAFHRRPAGVLRPVGAPLSDVQGVIVRPGVSFDLPLFVGAAGGQVVRFSSAPDLGFSLAPHEGVAGFGEHPNWLIDLADGGPAYLAQLKAKEAKHLANTARCARKAEREIGPVQFTFHDRSTEALAQLIAWKRARFAETGKRDLFTSAWIRRLFDVLWRWPEGEFGLVFATLRFGDRLAAGEIYLRKANRLHAWISSFDRDLGVYAPGHILTARMIEQADQEGVTRIDFGVGSDDYKAKWCLSSEPLVETAVYGDSAVARARGAAFGQWRAASAGLGKANKLLMKVRGRIDHVFAAQGNWAAASMALAANTLGVRPRVL